MSTAGYLDKLAEELSDAVRNELEYKLALANAKGDCELVRAQILFQADSEGLINGKNAEARKRQQIDVLAHNQTVQSAEESVSEWEKNIIDAQAWRVLMEARVGLVKALLYSHARIG